MIRSRNFAFSFAGTAVAVALLVVCVPRAAHAVVAALVQVSNTVSAPAITQSVSEQAQQLLEVECIFEQQVSPDSFCNFIAPTGLANGPSSAVTISPTQNFVITSVDLKVVGPGFSTCPYDYSSSVQINSPGGQITRKSRMVAAHSGTQHFAYPSGILIAGGTQFVGVSGVVSTTTPCSLTVDMFGYLTTL